MKEKRKKKATWYKGNRKTEKNKMEKEYKSVIFVQPTKGSILNNKYEEVIRKSKCNVKVVERAGRNVRQKLQKSYPFCKEECGIKDSVVCLSSGKGNCRKENVKM